MITAFERCLHFQRERELKRCPLIGFRKNSFIITPVVWWLIDLLGKNNVNPIAHFDSYAVGENLLRSAAIEVISLWWYNSSAQKLNFRATFDLWFTSHAQFVSFIGLALMFPSRPYLAEWFNWDKHLVQEVRQFSAVETRLLFEDISYISKSIE